MLYTWEFVFQFSDYFDYMLYSSRYGDTITSSHMSYGKHCSKEELTDVTEDSNY